MQQIRAAASLLELEELGLKSRSLSYAKRWEKDFGSVVLEIRRSEGALDYFHTFQWRKDVWAALKERGFIRLDWSDFALTFAFGRFLSDTFVHEDRSMFLRGIYDFSSNEQYENYLPLSYDGAGRILRQMQGIVGPREFEILVFYYGLEDGKPLETKEIAPKYGIDKTLIQRYKSKALDKICRVAGVYEVCRHVYTGADIGERVEELRAELEELHQTEVFKRERAINIELNRLLAVGGTEI